MDILKNYATLSFDKLLGTSNSLILLYIFTRQADTYLIDYTFLVSIISVIFAFNLAGTNVWGIRRCSLKGIYGQELFILSNGLYRLVFALPFSVLIILFYTINFTQINVIFVLTTGSYIMLLQSNHFLSNIYLYYNRLKVYLRAVYCSRIINFILLIFFLMENISVDVIILILSIIQLILFSYLSFCKFSMNMRKLKKLFLISRFSVCSAKKFLFVSVLSLAGYRLTPFAMSFTNNQSLQYQFSLFFQILVSSLPFVILFSKLLTRNINYLFKNQPRQINTILYICTTLALLTPAIFASAINLVDIQLELYSIPVSYVFCAGIVAFTMSVRTLVEHIIILLNSSWILTMVNLINTALLLLLVYQISSLSNLNYLIFTILVSEIIMISTLSAAANWVNNRRNL